ncbi:MAG: protein kinase [Archangiaceae bacterium]|nr:protein kinase [Archangiaceae bacterium]
MNEDFGHAADPHRGVGSGDFIGTFRLGRRLGRGSSSDVFVAENEVTQAIAAVKVLRPEMHDDVEMVRRFESEARTTNLVRHEHIVEILDIGIHAGWQHYILLEYLEGVTLAKLLEQPVEPKLATRLVLQLCAGLGAAHAKGVVHRDLKPANIFVVQRNGQPHAKLVDFGMAHRQKLSEGEHRTQLGAVLGTALYMSPEQTLGMTVDARADIYSLGVVMYELATGKLPFEGIGPIEVMRAHLNQAPQPPRSLNPSISTAYEEVILRCLAKEPVDRWPSMAELGRAVVASLDGHTQPRGTPAVPRPAATPRITPPHPTRSPSLPTQAAGSKTMAGVAGVRRQARIPTSFGVQVFDEAGNPLGDALVTDVSLGGAFVRSTLMLPLFSRVTLKGMSSAGPVEVIAEIVRLELGDDGQRGFGVRFEALAPEQVKVLEALHQNALTPPKARAYDVQGEAVLETFEPRAAKDHYTLLGLPRDSTTRRIRDVCERLAEEMSPRRFNDLSNEQLERFAALRMRLTEAEEVLIDPAQRALYDAINGNVLGVLRCITEGLDVSKLSGLRARFLKAQPDAELRTRGALDAAARAERLGDLDGAMSALADALCIDPLNLDLHLKAGKLRRART